MNWTSQLDDSMRQAVASGVSYGAFASTLNISRNSVLGRALRLRRAGIAGFEIKVPAVSSAASPFVPKPEPRVRVKKRKSEWVPEYDRMAGAPLWDRVSPDRVSKKKILEDVGTSDCKWIGADAMYCGHAIHVRSYCAFHYGIVYQVKRAKLPVAKFECYDAKETVNA